MKTSTIDRLHLGKSTKVEKQHYLKIRPYNKIKEPRLDSSNFTSSTSRQSPSESRFTYPELADVIECLNKDNAVLISEIENLLKNIKREEKIEKILQKKMMQMDDQWEENYEGNKSISQKDLTSLIEIKLSLEVLELENDLEDKCQILQELCHSKMRIKEEQCENNLLHSKTEFLKTLYSDEHNVFNKLQKFNKDKEQYEVSIDALNKKLKNTKKNKQIYGKQLEEATYEVKEAIEDSEKRKERMKKNSCAYIEVENGEIRNEYDIRNEINRIKESFMEEEEELQEFLEDKMKEKIIIINEIEKYEPNFKISCLKEDKQLELSLRTSRR